MGWGIWELIVVLAIVLVLFGSGKLPQLGKSMGSMISEFKEGLKAKNDPEKSEKTEKSLEQDSKKPL